MTGTPAVVVTIPAIVPPVDRAISCGGVFSDANYVLIHADGDRYVSRNSIKHLSTVLAPLGFRRIERSLLVNLGRVEFVEKVGGRRFTFMLRGGQRLSSSASYYSFLLRELRQGQLSGLARRN